MTKGSSLSKRTKTPWIYNNRLILTNPINQASLGIITAAVVIERWVLAQNLSIISHYT